jgi:hypothetical protein
MKISNYIEVVRIQGRNEKDIVFIINSLIYCKYNAMCTFYISTQRKRKKIIYKYSYSVFTVSLCS